MKKLLLSLCALVALSASALTYNVEVPAGTKACYIAGDMNGWSQQEMNKVDDTHYTIDIAEATEADGYKYCSGPGWNYVEKDANGNEMGNRVYSPNDVVARWASVFDPGVEVEKPEGDISIYLQVEGAYASTNLYAWDSATSEPINGAWPGTAMTAIESVDGVDYYVTTFTAPANAINIIFNDGTNQTADILGIAKTTYFKLNGNTATVVTPGAVEETETLTYNVTVPVASPSCYIAGAWDNWTSFTAMTMVDETHYTITLENVTKSMEYKYCATASWDNVEVQADGVSDATNRTWGENDVVAAWKGLAEVEIETLTYNVTVPEGTPACYIAGDMNSWGFTAMTKVDETHYTITFDNVHKLMGYKYACGEGWDYEEVTADGGQVYNRIWSENDVVAAWKTTGSVAGVEADAVKVYGANGMLCVRAAEEVALNVYNAQGMLVKALVVEGAADINLAAGLYIVNGTKVLVY